MSDESGDFVSAFWGDLAENMQDPEYAVAYEAAWRENTARDAVLAVMPFGFLWEPTP